MQDYSNQGIGGYDLASSADNILPMDYNGDGKTDFIIYRPGAKTIASFRSNGNGTFSQDFISFQGIGGYDLASAADNIVPMDYNGDGKTDFVIYRPGSKTIASFRSNGNGTFIQDFFSVQGLNGYDLASAADRIIAVDFNGDGKSDFIVYRPGSMLISVFRSLGNGSFWQDFGDYGIGGYDLASVTDSIVPMDYNGDGKSDFIIYRPGSQKFASFSSTVPFPDQLLSITNGFGVAIAVTYKPITNASVYVNDANSTYPYLDFQGPLYVVSQTQTSNGIGGNYATNYTYTGAKLHELGGGFLGFRQITANDPQTGITTTTTYRQDYPYQGLPQTVAKQTATGSWLNYAQNTWQTTSLGYSGPHFSDNHLRW